MKKNYFKEETTINRISLTPDSTHQVDFNTPNSLAPLIGFEKKKYTEDYNNGENLPKITHINSIVIHCDLVEGGYLEGQVSNAIYSFPSLKVS